MSLAEELGFYVEHDQVKSFKTRKDQFDNIVPASVRPASKQEIAMFNMLVEITT